MTQCHNDLKAEWHHLCTKALTPAIVTDEPLIHISQDVCQAGAARAQPNPELCGNVTAHGFWKQGMTAIFDICITNTDVAAYRPTEPSKVLMHHECQKKAKYNALCLVNHQHFTPLVFSVDSMQGKEATAVIKRVA